MSAKKRDIIGPLQNVYTLMVRETTFRVLSAISDNPESTRTKIGSILKSNRSVMNQKEINKAFQILENAGLIQADYFHGIRNKDPSVSKYFLDIENTNWLYFLTIRGTECLEHYKKAVEFL
jgi:hypothetical protein